jgi:hypothetical protein
MGASCSCCGEDRYDVWMRRVSWVAMVVDRLQALQSIQFRNICVSGRDEGAGCMECTGTLKGRGYVVAVDMYTHVRLGWTSDNNDPQEHSIEVGDAVAYRHARTSTTYTEKQSSISFTTEMAENITEHYAWG